jgi:hypothetical protein
VPSLDFSKFVTDAKAKNIAAHVNPDTTPVSQLDPKWNVHAQIAVLWLMPYR